MNWLRRKLADRKLAKALKTLQLCHRCFIDRPAQHRPCYALRCECECSYPA